jgi:UDPglucose 6-dehydrogenase
MKKSIGVIGQGFVGGSLTTVMSERGFDVYAYDKSGKYVNGAYDYKPQSILKLVEFAENKKIFSKVYFICLPTPMNDDGSADLSIVETVLNELANIPGERIAVVKSTVLPGSIEKWNFQFGEKGLHVIFNPEFLTEANALDDMRNQSRIILGGPRPWINTVKQVFQTAFPKIPIIKTSSTNAELTKYFTNCFLAMKISFANEMYQLCEALDKQGLNADYDRVVECATMDSRLGNSHWRVPSFEIDDNGNHLFGFSLSCFPKDLNALIHKEKELNLKPIMLQATWNKNLEVRPQKDWEKMIGRAVSKKVNNK